MNQMNRFSIRISGESGQGINSVGEILLKAFKNEGYYVFGYREYPSLIKGGVASYQIVISDKPVNSPDQRVDLMVSISRFSLYDYLPEVKRGGTIIHNIDRVNFNQFQNDLIKNNELNIEYINATEQSILAGGNKLTSNVFLLGYIWCKLGLDLGNLESEVLRKFGKNEKYIEMNKAVLSNGCVYMPEQKRFNLKRSDKDLHNSVVLSGNEAISLASITAGARAFYAYPMTPVSSILTTLAEYADKSGMLVRQVEDEISAVQMTLGSMYAGTRAFTATSGGGFDLMTESISMSGMAEIPLVIILGQRPGPATGLPTWSSASDLDLAVHAGHGEFPRIVLSLSDAESATRTISSAFNLAEKYQLPVIVLTEKHIAESIHHLEEFEQANEIRRGLFINPDPETKRYQLTESGVSPRWLPGSSESYYVTNSDEHAEDGSSTENATIARSMYEKRLKKMDTLIQELPEPELLGDVGAELTLITWGSTKGVVIDLIDLMNEKGTFSINCLHYEYLYPLRTEKLKKLIDQGQKLLIIENNYNGQFERMLSSKLGYQFEHHFRKYDGRPIYYNELVNVINKII